jgi:hypothetical protein
MLTHPQTPAALPGICAPVRRRPQNRCDIERTSTRLPLLAAIGTALTTISSMMPKQRLLAGQETWSTGFYRRIDHAPLGLCVRVACRHDRPKITQSGKNGGPDPPFVDPISRKASDHLIAALRHNCHCGYLAAKRGIEPNV